MKTTALDVSLAPKIRKLKIRPHESAIYQPHDLRRRFELPRLVRIR